MARLSENPDRDFSAGYVRTDLYRLLDAPPAKLEDVFDTPAIREYIGNLIADAIRKATQNK
jgi:hypothetical protein